MFSFKILFRIAPLLLVFLSLFGCSDVQSENSTAKVWRRVAIEKQGKQLAEQGLYDLAIEKYREAMKPEFISSEWQKATAIGSVVNIMEVQGRYREALEEHRWFFREKAARAALDHKARLESLIEYQDTGKSNAVSSHIDYLRDTYSEDLPPKGTSLISTILITDILLLYDVIGDHDGAIEFIDVVLNYLYAKHPEIERLNTSDDATPRAKFIASDKSDPNWRGYKVIREYLLVREAFTKDKAGGAKGRATRAIIQSDYFPW